MMLPTATRNQVTATGTPRSTSPVSMSVATTIAPEFTMLFAATVRAGSDLGTVVVRKAYNGTTNMPPATATPNRSRTTAQPSGCARNSDVPTSSGEAGQ